MNEDARISVVEEQIKVANNRIQDLEDKSERIENLTLSVQKLALSIEQMAKEQVEYREKQNELADRILQVEQKPYRDKADIHDQYIKQLATLIIGALVGFLLKTFFGI